MVHQAIDKAPCFLETFAQALNFSLHEPTLCSINFLDFELINSTSTSVTTISVSNVQTKDTTFLQ
jgi:hypothetical protein